MFDGSTLIGVFFVLGIALCCVTLSRRIGLGSIFGYLIAGIALNPWEAEIFGDAQNIMLIAEFGAVLLLFMVGLELTPARLWALRFDIFGLGFCQLCLCGGVLTLLIRYAGFDLISATIAGFTLALSSTAFSIQFLHENGQFRSTYGQKSFAILLFQDLSLVPLLAFVSAVTPATSSHTENLSSIRDIILMIAAILVLIIIGRYILPYLLSILARYGNTNETMSLAALLTAVGAASLTESVGMPMALGTFLAGVMLAESPYRYQLEAKVEPFRNLLLGLFFITVGMSLDRNMILENWAVTLTFLVIVMTIKIILIWGIARLFKISNADSLRIAVTIPQVGEFALVTAHAAYSGGAMSGFLSNLIFTTVLLSMAATPLLRFSLDHIANTLSKRGISKKMLGSFEAVDAKVMVVGFGRFGEVLSQMLTTEGVQIIIVEHNSASVERARKSGYTAYHGDVTNPDLLQKIGMGETALAALCFDGPSTMEHAIRLIRETYPKLPIFCRASTHAHMVRLRQQDVDFKILDTFESSMAFGRATLEYLGLSFERIIDIESRIREKHQQDTIEKASVQ